MRRLSSLQEEAERWSALEQQVQDALELVTLEDDTLGDDDGLISLEELVLEDEDMQEVRVKAEPTAAEAEPTAAESEPPAKAEGGEGVGDELAFLESLSLGNSEEAESFTFLEQRGSGTPQTIICPHCSAANDPAEWYCTECGEELPAE